jgi:hypothetical protein
LPSLLTVRSHRPSMGEGAAHVLAGIRNVMIMDTASNR